MRVGKPTFNSREFSISSWRSQREGSGEMLQQPRMFLCDAREAFIRFKAFSSTLVDVSRPI